MPAKYNQANLWVQSLASNEFNDAAFAAEVQAIKDQLENYEKDESISFSKRNFEERAKDAKLQSLYLEYKVLSITAAHPTADALNVYYELDDSKGNERNLIMWPSSNVQGLQNTLNYAVMAVLLCASAHMGITNQTAANEQLREIENKLMSMEKD